MVNGPMSPKPDVTVPRAGTPATPMGQNTLLPIGVEDARPSNVFALTKACESSDSQVG